MAFYECVYMARPDVSTTQVEAITEQITNIITERGGSVHSTEYWGLKSLAYRYLKRRDYKCTALKCQLLKNKLYFPYQFMFSWPD